MNKYKIIYRAIFNEGYIEHSHGKLRKKYLQRTHHYKAKTKKKALEKLWEYQGVMNGVDLGYNLWKYKIISVIKE